MKYFYIAVQIRENGKYYAYAVRVSTQDNLISKLQIPGIVAANIMPTKKLAYCTVATWNLQFKRNGEYLFDTLPDGSPAPF